VPAALRGPPRQGTARVAAELRIARQAAYFGLVAACSGDTAFSADMSRREARQAVWRLGLTASRDQLLLAWAQDPAPASGDLWRSLLRIIDTWRPPASPISGDDILALGVEEGPRVGRVRKAFEDWWLAEDFPEDRSAALDSLRRIARGDV
jgi:poly(A) polymerase